MTAGTATQLLPALIIDPVDYLLVDLATGRHLPGDVVHAGQLAHEHGLSDADALDALDAAACLGVVSCRAGRASAIVSWTPAVSQAQLHRLARAMVAAVGAVTSRDPYGVDVIDGEEARHGAVELFGLTVPGDVDLFLELARALLGRRSISVVDELVVPIAVLFSETAQQVHGLELAADAATRQELVCDLVRSLLDGRGDDFAALVADYALALSVD
ncbi:hypothetical protein GCM10025867_10180 [Frondihabitans sucicola]|uniref:Golgi phosphoprotein 3 GPP34 n=1 Tax=Frondihabitans sucicola TaxID=1268041 RepID=A0ABM8GK74_9MICO|nr:hypothetical protein [Frondihabitans sucicola]BDZ48777.1 hypothetical protein GCM10025867_10180 [Frondihabitans sucicola]